MVLGTLPAMFIWPLNILFPIISAVMFFSILTHLDFDVLTNLSLKTPVSNFYTQPMIIFLSFFGPFREFSFFSELRANATVGLKQVDKTVLSKVTMLD